MKQLNPNQVGPIERLGFEKEKMHNLINKVIRDLKHKFGEKNEQTNTLTSFGRITTQGRLRLEC